jgi:lysyl-tRNA synthetase, class I
MAEKFFWADQVADNVIRVKGDKDEYVCASGITPSGQIHIGNFREIITTDMVVKALRDKGKKVRFIYSWDDFDRFRKVPKGVSLEYEKYLGMPVSDIPSPFDNSMMYSEYFEKQFEKSLDKIGIKPEFIYQNQMNKKSAYADLIKISLEKRDQIIDILNKYRKEPLSEDWMPIMIYCDKCKKDLTKISKYDGYNITYSCECGFEETFDIRKKGVVSIKWRVDWPLRWMFEGVDFEPGGIDHSVHGGSFTTAKLISKEVFGFEPPVYQFYEWISIKEGGAFSSSGGNATSLDEVEEVYSPEVLRFLFVGTKPKSAFNISFDNDVIKLYEDYDQLEEKFFSGQANPREKRMYEFSAIDVPKTRPQRMGFRHLINLVQLDQLEELSETDKKRAEKVKNWLSKHAGDDMKFEVQTSINEDFSDKEKEALLELKNNLEKKKFSNEKELLNIFYEIFEKTGLKNTEFFEACYKALIKKTKGPRLGSLILMIGQEKVAKLLCELE